MKNTIGRFILLVDNYEEALIFYQDVLQFHILFDQVSETGKRYLHMAPAKKDTLGIWFIKAESEEQINAVGNQTHGAPAYVLYTDAFDDMHQRLQDHRVTIKKNPEQTADAKFLHFLDNFGNEVVMVQLLQTS